jgi:hypothetical protein
MTLLFYLSTLEAGLNFAQMEKPLGKTQFEWVCLRISVPSPNSDLNLYVDSRVNKIIYNSSKYLYNCFCGYTSFHHLQIRYFIFMWNLFPKFWRNLKVPKFPKRFYWNGPNQMYPHHSFAGRLLSVPIIRCFFFLLRETKNLAGHVQFYEVRQFSHWHLWTRR